ncbi:MAG: M23 family metallopeptidase [Flavobacteriales bacterium]|nr:M23 family metallopeptidase [Flavobacteriales bacterium]
MSETSKIKSWYNRIREKHKLTFINDSTYHEKWSFRLSSLNLLTLLFFYTIIVIISLFLLLRYTPLSGLVGGQSDHVSPEQVQQNSLMIDSLYEQTNSRQMYLEDLYHILNDEPFNDSTYNKNDNHLDENYSPDFSKNKEDSLLRLKIENGSQTIESDNNSADYEFFFAPVKGVVSQSFNAQKKHFGVDVITKKDDPIVACLDGTVILNGWMASEGNILVIQHSSELISVYKHCSQTLKRMGETVTKGDPIGIVGNSGENTSGPHLHFELWKNGKPINPQEFISF